eukprot:4771058-Amphidinium_carterae.1
MNLLLRRLWDSFKQICAESSAKRKKLVEVLSDVGILVDVDVVDLNVLWDNVPGLVDADVVEDADVLEEMLDGDVGVVELVVLDVEVVDDLLVLEGILVDVDVVDLNVLWGDVPGLVDANIIKNVDVLKEMLDAVGVLVEVENVNVNLARTADTG